MKLLTYKDILALNPCLEHHPSKYISEDWTGTILDVLNAPNVTSSEKLWVAYKVLDDKTLRLFAVNCARRALTRVANPDPRSIAACDIAEKYANGEATEEELSKAHVAANTAFIDSYADYADANIKATYDSYCIAQAATYAADSVTACCPALHVRQTAYYASHTATSGDTLREERETQIKELIKIVKENAND